MYPTFQSIYISTVVLLYGAEQWLPYYHPRKIHQHSPKGTFTTLPTQLPTDQVWKDLIYAHYSLHSSTPTLAVRAELGVFPTYIPGICRVSNYLAYLCDPTCPPLVAKAIIVQKTLAQTNKFSWWNNAWRLLQPYNISETTISPNSTPLKTDLQSEYRRWWIEYLLPPSHSPKLDTFCLFHPSFHTAPFLNTGPHYFRLQAFRFRCYNHRLDVEFGRHSNIPRHN